MTWWFWISLFVAGALGFGLRVLTRRLMPTRQWTRFALVMGWPWGAYLVVFVLHADLTDKNEWMWGGVGVGYLFFALLPYWLGYFIEWIWRSAIEPSPTSR